MDGSNTLRIRSAMERLGYDTFKSAEQEALITAVTAGHDALGILPTGAGKSAAFVVPTVARKWKTVVVSPLIALMADQVTKLRKNGLRAYNLNSEVSMSVWSRAALAATQSGHVFFYASPETLLTEKFARLFPGFRPDLLAIDEAHCVSTWGQSFRPHYLLIPEIAKRLGNPQCLALSATFDHLIERDVSRRLPLRQESVRVAMSPYRENLQLEQYQPGSNERYFKDRDLLALVKLKQILREENQGAVLVYCYSRNQTGETYERMIRFAEAHGYTPILYHADIPREDKELALNLFLTEPRPLVFCTSAFGMGIDRSDVRAVVHFDAPTTLLDYAQQIGRGGRDGHLTRCITLYNPRRVREANRATHVGIPTIGMLETLHQQLVNSWIRKDKDPHFNVDTFIHLQKIWAEKNSPIPAIYSERVVRGVGMLREVGLINDDESGFRIKKLIPGSDRHLQLIDLTEMKVRRADREVVRIQRFFESPDFSQELLWNVIGEE